MIIVDNTGFPRLNHAEAIGNPPLMTDDPGTPGDKHWEINIGFSTVSRPDEHSSELPLVDLNYGPGETREEQFDPNTDLGGNTTRTFTLGLNYLIKGDDLKLMVDYLCGTIPGSLIDGGRLLTRFKVIY